MTTAPNNPPADSGLLRRVAQGEESAVRETMDRFGGLVWSLAKRMSRSQADAEDAVQEIFTSIWHSADRFDPSKSSETTFVSMIARRRLIDRLRSTSRKPQPVELPDAVATPERADSAEVADDARRASAAFNELSNDQQRVLRLAIYSGYTHEQIATALSLPLGSVKTHARRGMIKLRDLMHRSGASPADTGAMA